MIDNSLLVVVGLSILDVTLTYFTLYRRSFKLNNPHRAEMNRIVRWIMGKGINPYNFLASLVYTESVIIALCLFIPEMKLMLFGALSVIIIYHSKNIENTYNMWDNQDYWRVAQIINDKY